MKGASDALPAHLEGAELGWGALVDVWRVLCAQDLLGALIALNGAFVVRLQLVAVVKVFGLVDLGVLVLALELEEDAMVSVVEDGVLVLADRAPRLGHGRGEMRMADDGNEGGSGGTCA